MYNMQCVYIYYKYMSQYKLSKFYGYQFKKQIKLNSLSSRLSWVNCTQPEQHSGKCPGFIQVGFGPEFTCIQLGLDLGWANTWLK